MHTSVTTHSLRECARAALTQDLRHLINGLAGISYNYGVGSAPLVARMIAVFRAEFNRRNSG